MRHFLYRTLFFLLITILIHGCMPRAGKESVPVGPDIRVLIDTIFDQDSLLFTGDYRLRSEEAEYEFGPRNREVKIRKLSGGIQIFNQNRNLLYRDHSPIILEPADPDGRFTFRGLTYTGTIILQFNDQNSVYMINLLNIEDYLKGVVPAEIPSYGEENLQAVKAQAICARTYALKKIQENKGKYFDITAGTMDQVYGSFDRHTPLADTGVEETRGMVITDQNQLATIYYHSTCGGRTEAGENIFKIEKTPYLSSLTDAIGDRFACASSPYFRWTETRTIDQIDSAFHVRFNRSYLKNQVTDTTLIRLDAQITRRSSSGRVEEMTISLGDTSISLNGYEVRRFLALPPAQFLKSNLFYIDRYNDSTLVLYGAGFGHGVGLCQFGALEMSRSGFQYYHILHKYFPTTVLTRKY